MGGMSELGPIDPQVDGLPVLAIPHALEKIAFWRINILNPQPCLLSILVKHLI